MTAEVRPICLLDFETRSEADLKEVGAWRYSEDPSTTVLCFSYKFGDYPTLLWKPPEVFPQCILDHIAAGGAMEAHNAMFEYAVWLNVLHKRLGLPMPTRWKDTMAVCAYRSLPLKLDTVGTVLRLDVRKDDRGKELIKLLCKPTKRPKKPEITKKKKDGTLYAADQRRLEKYESWTMWNNDPALLNELYGYCINDTDTEHCLGHAVGELPPSEQRIWALDMKINKRGVYIDAEGAAAAIHLLDIMAERGEATIKEITGGEVQTGGEIDKIIAFCAKHGVDLPDLTADTVEEHLTWDSLPDIVRKVLTLRQLLAKASVKKVKRLLDWRCADGRVRGMLQYHGSGTGRWAGRGPQPQNMPRGDENISGEKSSGMEALVDAIKLRDLAALGCFYGDDNLALAISSALRGLFIAAPGSVLNVGDFSAIEARVLAWVAGEQWKLDAFAAIDRGEGYKGSQDIYLATASNIYGYPCLTKKTHGPERQAGKTCELAFGYQGGIGAWRKFDSSDKWSDEEVDEKKDGWRAAHPRTQQFWYRIEDAAVECVRSGRPQHYRSIGFEIVNDNAGKWLTIILPNGRRLWYFNPRLCEGKFGKMQIEYEGRDNKKAGIWSHHVRTYGGMLTENIVQAISRDLMVCAMVALEMAGYPIILTVHDEVVCETPLDFGSEKEFKEIMTNATPDWAKGLPIAVGTFRKVRYEK